MTYLNESEISVKTAFDSCTEALEYARKVLPSVDEDDVSREILEPISFNLVALSSILRELKYEFVEVDKCNELLSQINELKETYASLIYLN